MKKLILATTLLLSTSVFAETETGVHTVFSKISASDAKTKMVAAVDAINSGSLRPHGCESSFNTKVYAASGPKLSYRVNRHGELQKQWTASVKYSCEK